MLQHSPVKKEYLLIFAAILLLLLGYQFAFKHTLQALKINRTLAAKLAQSGSMEYQPDYLQRKNKNLNNILNLYKADTSLLRSGIINNTAIIAEKENVKLTGVPVQDISLHTDHFILEKLEFEGDFFSLLKFSDKLQSSKGIGMVRSENWRKAVDRGRSKEVKKLVLEIYMEVYK